MGYYIETGTFKGKAQWILNNCKGSHGVIGRPTSVDAGMVPVCVVDNGPFDAAGIAFNPREAEAFDLPSDPRLRQWLIIRIEDAEDMCPRVTGHINWKQP